MYYGLPLIDIIVIFGYFAIVIAIGIWTSRHIKNREDFFLAGRKFGKLVQVFATFSAGTSSENAVSQTVMVARNGVAGISQQMLWAFGMPINWFIALWYRRLRYICFAEFFEERYGSKGQSIFYSVMSTGLFMVIIGMGMMAMTKTVVGIVTKPTSELTAVERAEYERALELEELQSKDRRLLTPEQQARRKELELEEPRMEFSYLNEDILMWVCAGVVIIYAVVGGLEAAFLSDTLQGMFIILLSLMMLPFAFMKINEMYGGEGLGGVIEVARSKLPAEAFNIWGSPAMVDFTWYYLIVLFIMLWINITILANQIVVTGSAKDEFTARYGFSIGQYVRRACCLFWGLAALLIVILYSGNIKNPDYLWGYACRDLLGPLGIGLVGLMIACLMAAMMSTSDALMLTASGLLTNGCLKVVKPNLSEKWFVFSGRFFSFFIIVGAVLIAQQFENVMQIMKFFWEYGNMLAASFLVGLLWRRATRIGAWSSMLGSAMLFLILPILIPLIPGVRTNSYLTKTTEPKTLVNTYIAREVDAERRQESIETWEQLNEEGKAKGEKPVPLKEGEEFEKQYVTPIKPIFWSNDVRRDENDQLRGYGKLHIELVALDWLGFDLAENPYALNETIRLIYQTVLPFVIIISVSLMTKPDDRERLDKFFVKMKTPVLADKKKEKEELGKSFADPTRFDHKKMFPNTNLEFQKFTKDDKFGLVLSIILSVILLAAFYLMVQVGKGALL